MTTELLKIEKVPDCIRCGACCFSTNPRYVRVTGKDYARFAGLAENITHFVENRCFMLVSDNRCVALSIDPATKRYLCTIYERRPQICRQLIPGSPQCLAEIERKYHLAREALENLAEIIHH